MRDWLALPLSPGTANANNTEGFLIASPTASDEDVQNYDIINTRSATATTTDGESVDGNADLAEEEQPEKLQRRTSWFSILNVFGVSNNLKKSSTKRQKLSSRSNSIATMSTTASSSSLNASPILEQTIVEERDEAKAESKQEQPLPSSNSNKQEETEEEQIEKEKKELVAQNARATLSPDMISENTDIVPSPAAAAATATEKTFSATTTAVRSKEEEVEDLLVSSSPSLHRNSISSANSSNISTDNDFDDNSTPTHSQILSASSPIGNNLNSHSTDADKTPSVLNTTVYTKVYWNHGGNKVLVTGEFDNWSASVNMIKDTENPHRYIAEIPIPNPSKDMEFKFIVDGEWRYAQEIPHRTDWRGNINNVIYKNVINNN